MQKQPNWTGILAHYATVALAGSLLVVVGTYGLAWLGIRPDLEPDALREHVSRSAEQAAEALRDRFRFPAEEPLFPPDDAPAENIVVRRPDRVRKPDRSAPDDAQTPVSRGDETDGIERVPETRDPVVPSQPQRRWGVVRTPDARVYSRDGKYLQTVTAGALVDVRETHETRQGTPLALCTLYVDGRQTADVMLLMNDLEIRGGTVAQAAPREKSLLSQHAALSQRIAERERELHLRALAANPHSDAYRKAREAYLAFARKAEELTAKRDNSTGGERLRAADALSRMKGQSGVLRRAYEENKKKFEEWNARQTPHTPAGDVELESLRKRQAMLENEMRGL
jgi:hypothetical protein